MNKDRGNAPDSEVVLKPEVGVTEGEPVTDDNGVDVEEVKNGHEGDDAALEFIDGQRFNV